MVGAMASYCADGLVQTMSADLSVNCVGCGGLFFLMGFTPVSFRLSQVFLRGAVEDQIRRKRRLSIGFAS